MPTASGPLVVTAPRGDTARAAVGVVVVKVTRPTPPIEASWSPNVDDVVVVVPANGAPCTIVTGATVSVYVHVPVSP